MLKSGPISIIFEQGLCLAWIFLCECTWHGHEMDVNGLMTEKEMNPLKIVRAKRLERDARRDQEIDVVEWWNGIKFQRPFVI